MSLSTQLRPRLVRYSELRPCTNAFIDARSPGSDQKENFTIIGAGVAENPNQYVHIREPHGFNIGGARQPPHCTNSLHSHGTAEVFIVHQGKWRFFWGEHGDAGDVLLEEGDTISIPVSMFRGFENVGEDTGFMFAILGGDDPGRVHWAPHVIDKARGYGLVLLENGNLVDTTIGESVPENQKAVEPSSREDVAYIRTPSAEEMTRNVVRHSSLKENPTSPLAATGVRESPVIGSARTADGFSLAPIDTPHDFTLRHLSFEAGARTPMHTRNCVEVLLVHRGRIGWRNDADDSIELVTGDTFTVPKGMAREFRALTAAEIFIVRGGIDPGSVNFTPPRV